MVVLHILVGFLSQGSCFPEELDQSADSANERPGNRTPGPRSQRPIGPISDEEEDANGDGQLQA
jgi:hypothetical protein